PRQLVAAGLAACAVELAPPLWARRPSQLRVKARAQRAVVNRSRSAPRDRLVATGILPPVFPRPWDKAHCPKQTLQFVLAPPPHRTGTGKPDATKLNNASLGVV